MPRLELRDLSSYITEMPSEEFIADLCDGKRGVHEKLVKDIIQNIIYRTAAAEAQNHRCAYCYVRTDAYGGYAQRPTLEHVVPRCRGGKRDHPGNHVMVCDRCNRSRGDNYIAAELYVGQDARLSADQMKANTSRQKSFSADQSKTNTTKQTSKRTLRKHENTRYGLKWINHMLVNAATLDVLGSYYFPTVKGNSLTVKLAFPTVVQSNAVHASRKKAQVFIEQEAKNHITDLHRARALRTKSLNKTFENS